MNIKINYKKNIYKIKNIKWKINLILIHIYNK